MPADVAEPTPASRGPRIIQLISSRRPVVSRTFMAALATANCGAAFDREDELVCLTELVPSNLTPAGRRMVGMDDR